MVITAFIHRRPHPVVNVVVDSPPLAGTVDAAVQTAREAERLRARVSLRGLADRGRSSSDAIETARILLETMAMVGRRLKERGLASSL